MGIAGEEEEAARGERADSFPSRSSL